MEENIEKLKKLFLMALKEQIKEDEEENYMQNKKQKKNLLISIFLTVLPILIFIITPGLAYRYFNIFSGQLIYTGQDHYFGFSPTFILDLPYLLPPIIWAIALWSCLKIRKEIQDRKSFFNYLILALTVLNGVFFFYSIWFLYKYFLA